MYKSPFKPEQILLIRLAVYMENEYLTQCQVDVEDLDV